ncbi:MAG: hypothetical protein PHU44_12720 [Syntrophales bacterium]|nr:hypothetical protein [Syntrophales bacterium]
MGCISLLFLFGVASLAAEAEPKVGQTVGNAKFPKPLTNEDAKYLGPDQTAEFTLKDIRAPYVLVEQMNTA